MEKYFQPLSDTGAIEIPKQFAEKFGWNDSTHLYQFARGGELYITDQKPEYSEQHLYESSLDGENQLTICKKLLDEANIGLNETLVMYVFYGSILGLTKDFRECAICGNTNELAPIKDKHICYDCSLHISGIEDNVFI